MTSRRPVSVIWDTAGNAVAERTVADLDHLGYTVTADEAAAADTPPAALVLQVSADTSPDRIRDAAARAAELETLLIVISSPEEETTVTRKLTALLPQEHWISLAASEPAPLAKQIAEAIKADRQKRRFRATLNQFNKRISSSRMDSDRVRQLIVSGTYFEQIVAETRDVVITTDADERIISWNPAGARAFGRAESEIGGLALAELLQEQSAAALAAASSATPAVVSARRADGSTFDFELTVTPLGAEGGPAGYALVGRDISERREHERERELLVGRLIEQTERVADLVRNVPGIVWEYLADDTGQIPRRRFVSEYAERMTGYSMDAWHSDPNFELRIIHPDDRSEVQRRFRELYRSPQETTLTFRWVRGDGRIIWVEAHMVPVPGEKGTIRGFRGVIIDVTRQRQERERNLALAALSERLARWSSHSGLLDGVLSVLVPRFADLAWLDVTTSGGAIDRRLLWDASITTDTIATLQRAFPPEIQENPFLRSAMSGEPAPEGEPLRPEHPAVGEMIVVPLEARGRKLGALTAALVNIQGVGLDADLIEEIASRTSLGIDNLQLYEAALAASASREQFLATVSHELRNPITSILGHVRLLRDGSHDPEFERQALETIEVAARSQSRLVEDLIDLSGARAGRFNLEVTPVDLGEVARTAVNAARPSAESRLVALSVDIPPEPVIVAGDEERLRQIVWNLLTNALKFTDAGGSCSATVRVDDDCAELVVSDTGIGIAPELMPQIFDAFLQGDEARRRGGLGIGLAVVRQLVDLHSGSIRAESEGVGQGTRFIIRLPLHAA